MDLELQPWLERLDELAQAYFQTPTPQFVKATGVNRWAKDWAAGRSPEEVWAEQQSIRDSGAKLQWSDIFSF